MTLADLIRGRRKTEAVEFASAIPAIPAIQEGGEGGTIARIATIALANPGSLKTEGPSAHADPTPLPSLPPAAEARRQKVLGILARDGGRYALYVENPEANPVIMALATPDGTCELLIPKDRYDPFAVLAIVKGWEREISDPDALWWRVALIEPGARTVEVDTPSGWTLADWRAYADRYHGSGCVVTPLVPLPKPRAPVALDEALRTACEGVAGITVEVFRSLLSPEDVEDIAAGAIHPKTLHAYAQSFVEGMR